MALRIVDVAEKLGEVNLRIFLFELAKFGDSGIIDGNVGCPLGALETERQNLPAVLL